MGTVRMNNVITRIAGWCGAAAAILVVAGCASSGALTASQKAIDRCSGGADRCVTRCLQSGDGFTRAACEAQCLARRAACKEKFRDDSERRDNFDPE